MDGDEPRAANRGDGASASPKMADRGTGAHLVCVRVVLRFGPHPPLDRECARDDSRP